MGRHILGQGTARLGVGTQCNPPVSRPAPRERQGILGGCGGGRRGGTQERTQQPGARPTQHPSGLMAVPDPTAGSPAASLPRGAQAARQHGWGGLGPPSHQLPLRSDPRTRHLPARRRGLLATFRQTMISWSKYSPSRASGDGAERSLPGAGASRRSGLRGSQPVPLRWPPAPSIPAPTPLPTPAPGQGPLGEPAPA